MIIAFPLSPAVTGLFTCDRKELMIDQPVSIRNTGPWSNDNSTVAGVDYEEMTSNKQ